MSGELTPNSTPFNRKIDYQRDGCQAPRPTGPLKCGRTPDAQTCEICGTMACCQHAIYLQWRVWAGAPERIVMCWRCAEGKTVQQVLGELLAKLDQEQTPVTGA